MALNATQHTARMHRLVRAIRPTRCQVVVGLAIEIAATLVGLPFPYHLAIEVAAHVAAGLTEPRPSAARLDLPGAVLRANVGE